MTTTIVQNNFPELPEVKKESFKNSNKDVSAFQQILGNNSFEQKKEDKKSLSNEDINSPNNEDDKVVKAENKNKQQIDKSNEFSNKNNIAKTQKIDYVGNITEENVPVIVDNAELPATAIDQDTEIKEISSQENTEQVDLPTISILPVEKNFYSSAEKIIIEEKFDNALPDAKPVENSNENFVSNDVSDSNYLVSKDKSPEKKSLDIAPEETISNQNILSEELVNKTEESEIDSQQFATKQSSDVIVVPQTAQNITQDQISVDKNIDVKTEPNKIINENKVDNKLNFNSAIENEQSIENVGSLNQNTTSSVRPNFDNKDNKNIDDLKLNSLNTPQNNILDDYNLAQDNLSDGRDSEYQNDDPIFDKVIVSKNEEKITLSFKKLSTDFAENIPHRVDQISLAVRAGLQNGKKEISLNMYPEALGNVDVKIEFDKDQIISVKIFVEKPETLRILVKDVAILEKSLSEVIKADDASLSFNLKDGGKGNEHQPADKAVNKFNVTNSNLVVSKNYQVNISSTADGVNITV